MCMTVHIFVCMYVSMYVYIDIHTCTHVHERTHTHAHTHRHTDSTNTGTGTGAVTDTHAATQAHTHTHTELSIFFTYSSIRCFQVLSIGVQITCLGWVHPFFDAFTPQPPSSPAYFFSSPSSVIFTTKLDLLCMLYFVTFSLRLPSKPRRMHRFHKR
jgi:hypothetical protein